MSASSTAAAGRTSSTRALGVETEVRLDYASQPVALHDRFSAVQRRRARLPDAPRRSPTFCASAPRPEDSARALVTAALDAGSTDNCTALVLDVVDLPTAESADIGAAIMQLPLIPVPIDGETIDGFVLKVLMSDGRYTRLFGAVDEIEGGEVALKFPKPQVAAVATYRAAFAREAWVGARVHSPWVGRTIELPPGRQTCLYTVMPLYQGELLETRLARRPAVGLEEGRNIAIKLARGAAALHRAGIIHRDIKPDNVILEREGSLKLIDLGVVRVPGLEDFPPDDIPGTPAYMAPEMFAGEPGNEATDIYALGVTMFRAFTGEYPYGNLDATSSPRRDRPKPLGRSAPGSSGLAAGRAGPRDRDRAVRPLSRHDGIRGRDGGGTGARPAHRRRLAHALSALPGPVLARRGRAARSCARLLAVSSLTRGASSHSRLFCHIGGGSMIRIVTILVALFGFAVGPVHAQDYPTRPIRILVPYAPGGISDIAARIVGAKLTEAWGQQVVVENRPGGNGFIAVSDAARSAPDGYTLVMVTTGDVAINPALFKNVPYNVERDLASISAVSDAPMVLAANGAPRTKRSPTSLLRPRRAPTCWASARRATAASTNWFWNP